MSSPRTAQGAPGATFEPWPGYPACPCSCGATGLKLQMRHDRHLVGCACRSCLGRRVRKSGKAGNRRAHLRLGGGPRTVDDDLFYAYSINVTIESKTGRQVEGSFTKFVRGEKARHWFVQAEKKIPVGADAMPALYLELAPSESYLVVKVPGKGLR